MNIGEIGTVFGMIVIGLCGYNEYADSQYVNHNEPAPYNDIYVLISAQNLKLLYEAQDELARLNERSTCDSNCIARKATLTERIRNLQE